MKRLPQRRPTGIVCCLRRNSEHDTDHDGELYPADPVGLSFAFWRRSQHMFSAMGGFEMNGNVTKQNSDQIFGYLKDRGMQIVSGMI